MVPVSGLPDRESVRELIRGTLAETAEANPHVIADELLGRINNEQADELIRWGLHEMVREENRRARSGLLDGVRLGRSKWLAPETPYPTSDGWKALGDFNVADLRALADSYSRRAEENRVRAEAFSGLADQLAASGKSTLGELLSTDEIQDLAA